MTKNNPPRDHHTVPEFYLRGFTENNSPFLWAYTRGDSYRSGKKVKKNNPYQQSVGRATVNRDFYARTLPNGRRDFASFELILAYKESESNPLLTNLRNNQNITTQEKRIFADYIAIMMKRVPKHLLSVKRNWNKLIQDFDFDREFNSYFDASDRVIQKKIPQFRKEFDDIISQYKQSIPDDIRLSTMVDSIRLPSALYSMKWIYLIAPSGLEYVTSDNPVSFFEDIGLNKPFSEFVFPISKHLALVGTRSINAKEGYLTASLPSVFEVNQRTMRGAYDTIYSSQDASWLVDMFNNPTSSSNLFFPI
jgi:hypothetical protein